MCLLDLLLIQWLKIFYRLESFHFFFLFEKAVDYLKEDNHNGCDRVQRIRSEYGGICRSVLGNNQREVIFCNKYVFFKVYERGKLVYYTYLNPYSIG